MNALPVLTQTFWSEDPKVCLLPEILELSHLLPKPGEKRLVSLAGRDRTRSGLHRLLWQPPVAENNGLYEQPSDTAAVMVIECDLRFREQREEGGPFWPRCIYEVDIKSVQRLAKFALGIPQGNTVLPHEETWSNERASYIKIQSGSYLWLWCFVPEVCIEALCKVEGDNWHLLYHSWLGPGMEESMLMNGQLSAEQTALLKQAKAKAITARDIFPDYLILDCI